MDDNFNYNDQIKRYLAGEMSSAEEYALEKKALSDPFLQDALDGYSELNPSDLNNDLSDINRKIEKANKQKNSFLYWKVAAAISLLIMGSFLSLRYMIDSEGIQNEKAFMEEDRFEDSEGSPTKKIEEEGDKDANQGSFVEDEVSDNQIQPGNSSDNKIGNGAVAFSDFSVDELEPENEDMAEESMENQGAASFDLEPSESLSEVMELEGEEKSDFSTAFMAPDNQELEALAQERKSAFNEAKEKRSSARAATSVSSNDTRVSGIITDENGEGLPGVNVVVKGTTNGVTSDMDGTYSISADQDDVLIYSSVGMETQERQVSGGDMDVEFNYDNTELSEVVVTGYGSSGVSMSSPAKPIQGLKALKTELETLLNSSKSGEVLLVVLTINSTGEISNALVKKSAGDPCEQTLLDYLFDEVNWIPAKEDSIAVEGKIRIKVRCGL